MKDPTLAIFSADGAGKGAVVGPGYDKLLSTRWCGTGRLSLSRVTEQEQTCRRLPEGWEYRLPQNSPMGVACRAGTQTAHTGVEAGRDMLGTTPIRKAFDGGGKKQVNRWGLHDMHLATCRGVGAAIGIKTRLWGTIRRSPKGLAPPRCSRRAWDARAGNCRPANRLRYPPAIAGRAHRVPRGAVPSEHGRKQ